MGGGYHYSNGMLTGLLIGNMLPPHNTVVYTGGGGYNNNALLYPDGRVVTQGGQLVGTYNAGQFSPIQNGPIVAQAVPTENNESIAFEVVVGFILISVVLICLFSYLYYPKPLWRRR